MTIICTYIGMRACMHVCVCVSYYFLITFTNILLILLILVTKEFLIINVKLNAKRK